MLFTIGLILFGIAFIVMKSTQSTEYLIPDPPIHDRAAYVAMLGLLMMLTSLCMLAWRYLP